MKICMECWQKKDAVLSIRWHTDDCNCIVDIRRSNSRHRIAIFKTRFAMQRPYENSSKFYKCLIISGLYGQFLGASLSAKTWESGSRPRNSEGVLLSGGHRWELALIRWPPLNKTRLPLGKPNSLMARPMQGPRRGAREPRPQGANPAISTRS